LAKVDYKILPLFSTPIFIKEDLPITEEEIDYLKSTKFQRMNSKNGDYSTDKYVLDSPQTQKLKQHISHNVNRFVFDELKVNSNIEFYMTNSWVVKHSKGDWAQNHVHTNCILSGIYYFDVTDNSGDIHFAKEYNHTTVFPMHLDLDYTEWNLLNCKSWSFKPKNNELYLFPPWLGHSVSDNESDLDRYSIAFNFYVKGKIGSQEYQLEIK